MKKLICVVALAAISFGSVYASGNPVKASMQDTVKKKKVKMKIKTDSLGKKDTVIKVKKDSAMKM